MFFVISSGRSGSLTISETLNSFNNCRCYHHIDPQFIIEATQYYYGKYPGDKIADILRTTRSEAFRAGVLYGEVNLQFCLFFPVLEEVFPGSKYIWLMRDGRDVVASMYYRRWYDPLDKKVPDEWKEGRLRGNLTGDFSSSEWENMSRFSRCCWLWKKYNRIIESYLKDIDKERWMSVRLDGLKTSLPKIVDFLGLVNDRRVLVERLNKAYQQVSYWKKWDSEKKNTFETICSNEMNEWFPEWKNESGDWLEISPEVSDNPGFLLQLNRFPKKMRVKIWEIKRNILRYYGSINN